MATDVMQKDSLRWEGPVEPVEGSLPEKLRAVLKPLASLKLTVTLFALAIVLVFTGTLAQARHDIWWVLHNYFRTPVAWIEFNVFFPPAWFADYPKLVNLGGSFPFPGGFTIGLLMAANLLAAHAVRFKVQTRGLRLWSGLGVITLGCLLTWLVIAAGPDTDGSQATAPVDWLTLWRLFLVGIACVCGGIAAALFSISPERKIERIVLGSVGTLLLGVLAFLLFGIDSQAIDPSAMRILWQLIKAEFAALVLLAGCVLAFRKRAGIVLLHAGVGLIMANELVVHFLHKEEQMRIIQGSSANYAEDIRATELAIVDGSAGPKSENVVAFPEALLQQSLKGEEAIEDKELPFTFKVLEYYENAGIEDGKSQVINPATAGIGRLQYILPEKSATGSDAGDKVNLPAAYVEFFEKGTGRRGSGKSLGVYMLGVLVGPQKLTFGGKTYDIAMRFERGYKPYTIKLDEVRGDMYMGTNVPRNYSSDIRIQDPDRGVDRLAKIRMNEPLRYAGETLYQSGYDNGEREGGLRVAPSTTLQVVTNFGWMIPYVACMVIITGMLAQFIISLTRFLRRRADLDSSGLEFGDRGAKTPATPLQKFWNALVPIGMVGLFAAVIVTACMPAHASKDSIDLVAAGKIPIVYGGRVQPLDSLARGTLRSISGREVLVNADETTSPAMVWLMDVIARPDVAAKHRVFRIDSPDVRHALKLSEHPAKSLFGGSVQRYSPAELAPEAEDFKEQVANISKEYKGKEKQITTYDKKLMELSERGQIYQAVADGFHLSPEVKSEISDPLPTMFGKFIEQSLAKNDPSFAMPDFPTKEGILGDKERSLQAIQLWLDLDNELRRLNQGITFDVWVRRARAPLAIPTPESRDGKHDEHDPKQWEPFASAWLGGVADLAARKQPNEALKYWQEIIEAYANQDAKAFNTAVKDYTDSLAHDPPTQLERASPAFEAWFNAAGLFSLAQWFYIVAFCFVALFWMTGWKPLSWTAMGLLVAIFAVHTFALVARMSISGRPPVTNLYSTALFIGWAGVLLGFILELVYYRLGFGAAIAALIGFGTLIIADKLSLMVDGETRGDTIGVMRAVLDTQFWLATHVTTVNLGYATTYVAGALGLVYVIAGVFTHALTKDISKLLARMIYGALCFAMFFSFLGTVLGGLWADDSWGRFWGWDPKENGALIIVIWNALALHARWDGMVKDRGLALLAIGGIIFTSWSYFGVNQLGVGLHSYGFTEGVLLWLGIVCATALGFIALGALPTKFWLSGRELGTRTA